jgi:beta-lactam-binding protein with PASTA domain
MTDTDGDPTLAAGPDEWPTRPDGPPYAATTEETLVAPAPPPPPVAPVEPVAVAPADRRIGAGMLLALGFLVLVAAGIAIAWLLTHRHSSSNPKVQTVVVTTAATTTAATSGGSAARVAVPRLVGTQLSDAEHTLEGLGFKSTVKSVTSSKPAGTVLDQSPATGSNLRRGSTVALTVAAASSQTTTPSATPSTTQSTPATTTTAATTTPATTTPATTTTPAATTTATTPPQPQSATVPDVSGQQEATAVQSLFGAGIIPSLVWVPAQDELGTVEQIAKPAGTKLPYHAHVQVNLSTGPGNKPMEQVPNVVGQSLQQAVASLQHAQLRLIFVKLPVTSRAQVGKIVQQTPAGGQAPHNAQILVFLGVFKQ